MWKDKPTVIETWIEDATHVAFFDENGDTDMKYIVKCRSYQKDINDASRYFGLTSILMEHDDVNKVAFDITMLKNKYWPETGCYKFDSGYKKVCLHSREIRKQIGPFSKSILNGTNFMDDLNVLMSSLPISITSCFMDKVKLYDRYGSFAQPPYNLSVTFVLERLVKWQLESSDKVIIILESRGKKEDAIVLDTILRLIKYGTEFVKPSYFNKIIGVYFNPKRCPNDCTKSYYGLEIADLCAYPIFKYCRNKNADRAFEIIKSKIYGYPKYSYGIKKFP